MFGKIFYLVLVLSRLLAVRGEALPFERLDVNNSVLLIVDQQVGMTTFVRDFDSTGFYRSMLAHASIGNLFNIPVILTSIAQNGANGPLLQEITDMYPDISVIKREGEIDAWDNPEFRKAVESTGRKQMILAGIATDVCTALLAISLREQGYSVWANVEASGTYSTVIRDVTNARMQAAGVQLVGINSIFGYLLRDWRNPQPGRDRITAWMSQYLPEYQMYARVFDAGRANGTA